MARDVEPIIERVVAELSRYPDGLHRIAEPALMLDHDLPAALAAVYREFDGADLFHEALVLLPSVAVKKGEHGYHVGSAAGDDLFVGADDRVYSLDGDGGDVWLEATSIDRYLSGFVDAEALVHDRDGEFVEGVFDDAGELTVEVAMARARAFIKRDRGAAASRWRLGRALESQGDPLAARAQFEQAVESDPNCRWAWYSLGRISEQLGEHSGAVDEYLAAAEGDHAHSAYFLAHAARASEDDDERAELAARVRSLAPSLCADQLAGARELAEAGDPAAAARLCDLVLAVNPRDIAALELRRTLAEGG